jgi:tetratricopeptide (TPR) repeat protein
MKCNLFLLLLIVPFTVKANPLKFPLYKIGVKFDKPETHFLLTPEKVNILKKEIFVIVKVCEASKKSLEEALSNPNYQVLLNENNYNEIITFVKFPHFEVTQEIPESLKERLKEQCYSLKNASIEYLSDNVGTSPAGNYISFLYKVTTPEISYYSEGFFIETRKSTILVTINTINKPNNISFINSIEDINSEEYDNILEELTQLMKKDDYNNALIKISEAIKIEPTNELAYEKRIAINFKLKNYNEVLNDANSILKFDTDNINALLIKGLANQFLQNYNEAINCFEKAHFTLFVLTSVNIQNEYISTFAEIYRLKAEAFIYLKNSEKAIANLQDALVLSYDSLNTASIYYNLGIVASTLQNNPSEAIKYYSLAINNYPSKANEEKSKAFYNRGINFRKNEKPSEAIKDYTSAIIIKPDYVKAYNNRALTKLSIEDYKGAIADYNQVIKLDNGQIENIGIAYFNRGTAKLNLDDIKGCEDMKKAKSLGQSVPQEILDLCK